MFGLFTRWRRRRMLARPMPEEWFGYFERMACWPHLSSAERDRLITSARVLLAEKNWEGCGGLVLNDRIRVTIAAEAAMLVLHAKTWDWPNVSSILVYPHAFFDPTEQEGESGVVSQGHANHGEAWLDGPVILDWHEAHAGVANPRDGRNLVLHEFAHKLDMLDDTIDGRPPLDGRVTAARWREVMMREYEALCDASDRGRVTVLDDYGAENAAEFFSVVTESFFEEGAQVREGHRELYEVLSAFYGVDPAGWGR